MQREAWQGLHQSSSSSGRRAPAAEDSLTHHLFSKPDGIPSTQSRWQVFVLVAARDDANPISQPQRARDVESLQEVRRRDVLGGRQRGDVLGRDPLRLGARDHSKARSSQTNSFKSQELCKLEIDFFFMGLGRGRGKSESRKERVSLAGEGSGAG